MKQPHTEEAVRHTDDQQNTGNHRVPGSEPEKAGTRRGAENVEPARPQKKD